MNVVKAKDKKLLIADKDGKNEQEIAYDKIFIALGRVPSVVKLSLEEAGIQYDEKGISVDGYNRTNKKHIYAIGDCVK